MEYRWQQIEELFHAACELDPEARVAFLDSKCGNDTSLRREVERLLAGVHQQVDIIDNPPIQDAFRLITADRDDFLAGQMVNQYSLIARLGEGGMAEVYLAEDTKLQRKVALKLLPRFLSQDEDRVSRLQKEARAASALNHVNLITVYDIAQADSLHFIAMEFVPGQTLRQQMRGARMPLREALDAAIQIASGLAAAQQAGIIHRDIKPENIMLRDDGCVKILDFGIAKLKEHPPSPEPGPERSFEGQPGPSELWGTVSYMSPEQARRQPLDHRTDIFSLGVLLYEMVTGKPPFEGETAAGVLASVLNDEPQPVAERRRSAPVALETIIRTALKKNREERYQSANELLGDLERLRNQMEAGTAEQIPRPTSPKISRSSWHASLRLPVPQRAVRHKEWFVLAAVIAALASGLDILLLQPEASSRIREVLLLVLAIAFVVAYAYLRWKAATIWSAAPACGAFRGLAPFQEEDRERFCGRESDIRAIVDLVIRGEFRFGVLYGDSGAGKTSLLTAGVIPEIREQGLLPIYCRSYEDPLAALIDECARRSGVQPLDAEQHIDYVRRVCEEQGLAIVIICDQFEEFFVSFRTRRERERFVSFVENCYRRTELPVKFLFSIRADFLYQISSEFDRRIPEPLMSDGRYHLRHFDQEQAKQIIEESARAAGLPLASNLCLQAAGDLAVDDEVLPSELQVVGWQLENKGIHTVEAYRRAGGKEQLMSSFLDEVIQQAENREAAQLVLRSLISGENTRVTLPLKEITRRTQRDRGLVERTIRLFVKHRLFREIQDGEPWRYEVMHEYLIPMINRSTAKVMDARQRANQRFQRHRLDYQMNPGHRVPLTQSLFIWRYSDIERGAPERNLLKKSLQWGLVKAGLLALLLGVVTTGLAAWLSQGEEWEEVKLSDGHSAAVRGAVFSPDGRLLVSAGEDGRVIVWDFAKRARIATLTDHTDRVSSVAFSPDGKWFATGSYDHTVIVWDAARLEKAKVLSDHQGEVQAVAFSPDGRLLAVSQSLSNRTILWDVGRWEKVFDVPFSVGLNSIAFTRDGRRLIGPGLGLWEIATARIAADQLDPNLGGNSIALSPDGKLLAALDSSGDISFVDMTRRKPLGRVRGHHDHGRCVAFSPDGRLVASAAENVVLWDATTRQKLVTFEYASIVWSVAFSPAGRWLVSTHGDGAIIVWDVAERERVANLNEHSGPVRAVAFSSDGRRIASASEDRSIIIWDAEHGTKQAVLTGHNTRVNGVAFSPDATWIASCDQDGNVICWDIERRQTRWIQAARKVTASYCLATSPDGRWIATSSGVYDSADGHQAVSFDSSEDWLHANLIYGIAFSLEGRWMAYAVTNGYLVLWDTDKWQASALAKPTNEGPVCIGFSSDGRWLVTGYDQGQCELWSVSPLRKVAVIGRHAARVKSVAFSPDGKQVASASDDKTIALWDVSKRSLITHIGIHTAPVLSVAFSPDGRRLVSGEHDNSVRLYTRHRSLWGHRLD
jgi:WD40 repeat protein/serine/threonine protein kinase